MTNILLLEAKCARCHRTFGYPTLSDFAYGEMVLCTLDGKHQALVNAFGEFAQQVSALLESGNNGQFWEVLASLADPLAGQSLTPTKRCPHCGSSDLQSWGGSEVGIANIPSASFESVSSLATASLAQCLTRAVQCEHEA